MTKKKSFRKLLAAVCALTLVGGMGAAVTANAADGVAPWAENHPTTGSIKITKTLPDQKTAVPGAEFTVTKVTAIDGEPYDLTTYDGWNAVAKKVPTLNTDPNSNTVTLDTNKTSKTTNDSGVAVFDKLALGLYKVEETMVPTGYSSDVKPFFMTIPEITGTDSNNLTYTYDVEAKPKNKDVKDSVSKTGDYSATVGEGDEISYTITSTLNKKDPAADKDLTAADINGFAIFDDAQTNAYQTIDASAVKSVKIEGQQDSLVSGTDYTVAVNADPDTTVYPAGERTRVQINFTEDGLTKIAAAATADAAPKVLVNLTFKLKTGENAPDSVTNKFGFVPGHGTDEPVSPPVIREPKDPDPKKPNDPEYPNPTVKFRQFQINKTNSVDSKPLAGADFIAFANKTDAENCVKTDNRDSCSGASANFETRTTGGDGKTPAYKARVGATFYVVEKKAPKGFILSNNVTAVTIDSGNTAFKTDITNVPIPRNDPKIPWFKMPSTGATGVGIFALLGAGLVAGGTAMHMRSRRRENA
ncbi:LPXTG-domain-containing protein cell wall anchor domain [Propionimicrobium lymphophilum ACS-093-V-SCH5]|uniref:LPXTG-domain-containing protein cell wall anchor domain n=1 Tax=Propionimicrobium lymphophilum ACS-093-V-SCH5 TaxID=883161 RepID=S2VZR8_9ACTN|nr:SpaH/EbpB family LPXTG-anchored major pilin [Propionimicrobium lymphophilum]EPD33018.1 LPXTG-domain-containing protein cell wall anchor domain [Propionimicrobium lymphophilum ACS-093-V-SCH5]